MRARKGFVVALGLLAACGAPSSGVRAIPAEPAGHLELWNVGDHDAVCLSAGLVVTIPAGPAVTGRLHSLLVPIAAGDELTCAGTLRIEAEP